MVEASILGSIIVNVLLILGTALLATGLSNTEPIYNTAETQLLGFLLFISVFVFIMPVSWILFLCDHLQQINLPKTALQYTFDYAEKAHDATLKMTRISALVVLLIYTVYFVYELRTHPLSSYAGSMAGFDVESQQGLTTEFQLLGPNYTSSPRVLPPRTIRFADEGANLLTGEMACKAANAVELGGVVGTAAPEPHDYDDDMESRGRRSQDVGGPSVRPGFSRQFLRSRGHSRSLLLGSSRRRLSRASSASSVDRRGLMRSGREALQILRDSRRTSTDSAAPEQPPPRRCRNERVVSILVLVMTSILMSLCAEFLLGTIDDVTHQGHLSESVIGLIILPIVGNIAEYVTVVTVAARDKLDLAIAVAVGSAIQIALCVAPLTVIAGWIVGRDMLLTFDFFEIATLLGTALLVSLLVFNDEDSTLKAGGLKGALMCACYVIIG